VDELHELSRQVERGSLFAHTVFSEHSARTNTTEALINGLADLLVRRGVVDSDELLAAVEQTRREIKEAGRASSLNVVIRGDGEEPEVSADEIDCEARIPYCQAVCCRLRFPLTVEEIEHGPLKWDLGLPYFNRHDTAGYCIEIDHETHGCGIYHERPAPCRQYSCKGDDRIWKDFDGMVINQEWIDSHLTERTPIEVFMSLYEDE
jgi:Fe-S-cluster containining protein